MTTQTIRLKGCDGGATFVVNVKAAQKSVMLKNMIEDTDVLEKMDVITIPKVTSKVLNKVIEWSEHHRDDREQKENDEDKSTGTDEISAWDVEFLKANEDIIFDIITAANFMDVPGLLDCSCQTIANKIKGKTPEEIREKFYVENDFSPEEEQKIKEKNAWCELL